MHPLTGSIKRYDWGSPDAIPAILGIHPDGRPLAEYWLGAHPSDPATIDGHLRLDEAIKQHPCLVGDVSAFGDNRVGELCDVVDANPGCFSNLFNG